jgi:septum formation protein
MSLAYLKAVAGARTVAHDEGGFDAVVGADTVCVCPNGQVLGQPSSAADALAMVRGFVGREHRVVTGIAIVRPGTPVRALFSDSSIVRLGSLEETELRRYAESGEWAGKAGGYNYRDRLAAGWPLFCDGDPESVMGLPVRRVRERLLAFLADGEGTHSRVAGPDAGSGPDAGVDRLGDRVRSRGVFSDSAGSFRGVRGTVGQ